MVTQPPLNGKDGCGGFSLFLWLYCTTSVFWYRFGWMLGLDWVEKG